MPLPTPMPQERPRPRRAQRRRLLSILGALLLLTLVAVCGIRVVLFVRAELTRRQLPTSNVAPPACAHETAHTSPPALHDSLFAAVSSTVWASNGGFIQRGASLLDANDALCILRTSDGAIVGHYALAHSSAELLQADGVLYAEGATVPDEHVCALRAQDGTQLWCRARTGGNSVPPLILSRGILYLHGDTALTALRASDGATLWSYRYQGPPSSQTPLDAMAVVPESDTVYILTSVWRVCALRASDGTPRWCTPRNPEMSNSPSDPLIAASSVAADTTGVYLLDQASNTDNHTRIVALHATDGALLWQRPLPRYATAYPSFVASNGLLYLTTDPNPDAEPPQEALTALQTSDGTTRWETTTDQSLVATVQGDAVYLADSSSVQALQASTGTRLWKQGFRSSSDPGARLLVSGNLLVVRDEVENLYAFNTSTGQRLWERIQCVDDSDISAAEPHTKNGALVWCTWGTDRLQNGLVAPTELAAGA
jgi:outer membrane protein assembly factor BamB